MSIFGSIMSKIFHPGGGSAAASPAAGGASAGPAVSASSSASSPPASASGTPSSPVDVEAVLKDLSSKSGQQLNWQTSIVDLMKLLNLDSSLTARKELAGELNYTGDTNDSATMNIWLHKQVMQKLAENGGKVPDSLKA